MNYHSQLQLQAYLDAELPPRESREVESLLATDNEARQLLAELRMTQTVLAENEPHHPLPESRDFYWSKIKRDIERIDRAEENIVHSGGFAWQKFLAPLAAAAMVLLGVTVAKFYSPVEDSSWSVAEVERFADDASSVSFRSESEKVFVVWVYQRKDDFSSAAPSTLEMVTQ
jgi:anti-sigma factor RsiW